VGERRSAPVILMADDDEDDCLLAGLAFEKAGMVVEWHIVRDGSELMDYLYRRGRFSGPAPDPFPDLILLDLNMPKKDGREALREIKSDPSLMGIPVVILTTSREERDIVLCNEAGASSFTTKPVMFEEWVKMARSLSGYLPKRNSKQQP